MTDAEKQQAVEAALTVSWDNYKVEHPGLATAIEQNLDEPVITISLKALADDAAFQALLAQTENETDIAGIIKVIVPMAMSIASKLVM